jgi:peptide deformylase
MAIREILTYPDDKLREVAEPVAEPASEEVRQLVQDLADAMYDAPGVGLAATQIGVPLRVAVTDTVWKSGRYESVEQGHGDERDLRVWINPAILWHSDETAVFEEGCLSVPEIFEEVERPAAMRACWFDLEGNRHEAEFNGFQAVALQHEFDHLDGKLFIDKLSILKQKLLKKKLRKRKKMQGR